jgi:hypothetical protein
VRKRVKKCQKVSKNTGRKSNIKNQNAKLRNPDTSINSLRHSTSSQRDYEEFRLWGGRKATADLGLWG